MSDYKRQPPGHDCPPRPKDPADQPHPPGVDTCDPLPTPTPPTLDPPEKCPPDPKCKCPTRPTSDTNCLEKLIAQQATEIAGADKAKAFKADLEALLAKARAASQDYTRAKHEKLTRQWDEEDVSIAELVRKVVCALPCWRCVIDCYVCPLLNELHYAEERLYRSGTPPTQVNNLYELQFWYARDRDAKERRLTRIKNVLAAWEKPAQTIEKILNDNQALIDSIGKLVGTDPGKAVCDVFLRLVPMHLAIAPPGGSAWTTRIGREFTEFCSCDKGTPDNCCGPDVGAPSLRQRLIGPQPYLVDPNDYFKIICCLVENRYGPAKDAWSWADAKWSAVDADIKRNVALLESGLKSLDKDAKAAIPSQIDCCDYETDGDADQPQQTRR